MTSAVDLSSLTLTPVDIALRLLCAMMIGAIIGTEREYTHRPAGMRTHMLVSLGACAIMVTSQLIFVQYRPFGATPDPARLSAQVVTGVGFLGAGTIIREGASIKGLTTAASIWAVACLGLAVGGGYYAVGLIGTACMMITLTLFEAIQQRLMKNRYELYSFRVAGTEIGGVLELISTCAAEMGREVKGIQLKRRENDAQELLFKIDFSGKNAETRLHQFIAALSNDPRVSSLSWDRSQL